ncbi:MAG: DUF2975 domain-containing protein [candidate division Zixibacteria bacterium]|nr:DUF2975 domain-containing protein [candidate division Zixibacteria bacterium]
MTESSTPKQSSAIKAAWISVQILWYLGWVIVAVSLALLIATTFTSFRVDYVRLPVNVTFEEPLYAATSRADVLPVVGYEGSVVVDADRMGNQGVWVMLPFLLSIGYMIIVYQLRELLRNVRTGHPFNRDNARRLRTIGYLVIAAGPVFGLMSHIYARLHVSQLHIPGGKIDIPFDVHPFVIFAGLIVLVVAHVFDYGTQLQSEQDMTI